MTGEEAHWAGLGPEDCEPEGATMKDSHGQTAQCGCVHWYPRLEDREKCPLHSSEVRPWGHDYWDGARCMWLDKPVWPSQKSWVDDVPPDDAPPPTIVQDYRAYTAEEIVLGIVKFTEQAGWGDPANLGHWLGAAQRWALKERV